MSGINKTLYNNRPVLLTSKEVMDSLHIKDFRTFKKIVQEKNLPCIIVDNKYLVDLEDYNKWLNMNKTNKI